MPIDIVALSSILMLPLASVPVASSVSEMLEKITPEHRVNSWAAKVENIVTTVSSKERLIPDAAMETFLEFVNEYIEARLALIQQMQKGKTHLLWRTHADKEHATAANAAWKIGMSLSTEADLRAQQCRLKHKGRRTFAEGEAAVCAQCEVENKGPMTWAVVLEAAMLKGSIQDREDPRGTDVAEHTGESSQAITDDSEAPTTDTTQYVAPESILPDMPLDEEESDIMEGIVEKGLMSAGLSWDDIRAWKS